MVDWLETRSKWVFTKFCIFTFIVIISFVIELVNMCCKGYFSKVTSSIGIILMTFEHIGLVLVLGTF